MAEKKTNSIPAHAAIADESEYCSSSSLSGIGMFRWNHPDPGEALPSLEGLMNGRVAALLARMLAEQHFEE